MATSRKEGVPVSSNDGTPATDETHQYQIHDRPSEVRAAASPTFIRENGTTGLSGGDAASIDRAAEGDQGTTVNFQSLPTIAPPRPARLTLIEALNLEDTEDTEEEWEERDREIKKAATECLKGSPPLLHNQSEEVPSTDSGTLSSNNSPPRIDRGANCSEINRDNDSGETGHELARSEIPTNNDGQGGRPIEGSTLPSTRNASESNLTLVYGGSDALVDVASPSDTPQPILYNSDQTVEIAEAYLVESRRWSFGSTVLQGEIVQPWHKRTLVRIAIVALTILFLVLISIIVFLDKENGAGGSILTSFPSAAPSFDPAPTLETVRARGEVLCGLGAANYSEELFTFQGFTRDLCRAVASVVLGDPGRMRPVIVATGDRFVQLRDQQIDLLITGDYHTLEREVVEPSTGIGFSFTSTYYNSGAVYVGERTYVGCAETEQRFGTCSGLRICVEETLAMAEDATLKSKFPPSFFVRGSLDDVLNMLDRGDCNVIASGIFRLMSSPIYHDVQSGRYAFSNATFTEQHLAIVTQQQDHQWSTIAQGVLQSLLRGWQEGLSHDSSICLDDSPNAPDISFIKAPACVGNIGDLYRKYLSGPFTQGASDMVGIVTSHPFGSLDCTSCADALQGGTLAKISQRKLLNCGVINVPDNEGLSKMSELYCRAIAVAIFQGDSRAVNITRLESSNELLQELSDGLFDVIAGENEYMMSGGWSPDLSSWSRFSFSVPYYYDESLDEYGGLGKSSSLSTRHEEGDAFPSFINAVVSATIHAAKHGLDSDQMPFIDLFGEELRFMLRDVISYIGDYDAIYYISHGVENGEGWNSVNRDNSLGSSYMHVCYAAGRCQEKP